MLVYHVLVLAKEPRVFKMIPECPRRYGTHVLLSDVRLNWVVRDYLLLFLMGRVDCQRCAFSVCHAEHSAKAPLKHV